MECRLGYSWWGRPARQGIWCRRSSGVRFQSCPDGPWSLGKRRVAPGRSSRKQAWTPPPVLPWHRWSPSRRLRRLPARDNLPCPPLDNNVMNTLLELEPICLGVESSLAFQARGACHSLIGPCISEEPCCPCRGWWILSDGECRPPSSCRWGRHTWHPCVRGGEASWAASARTLMNSIRLTCVMASSKSTPLACWGRCPWCGSPEVCHCGRRWHDPHHWTMEWWTPPCVVHHRPKLPVLISRGVGIGAWEWGVAGAVGCGRTRWS